MVKTDFVPTTPAVLRSRIAAFEATYGVETERLTEAFTEGGRLIETDDLHTWAMLADTLEAIGEPLR
jgi:hypothetical protein